MQYLHKIKTLLLLLLVVVVVVVVLSRGCTASTLLLTLFNELSASATCILSLVLTSGVEFPVTVSMAGSADAAGTDREVSTGWGQLSDCQEYGSPFDKPADFTETDFQESRTSFREYMHAAHAMFYMIDDELMWNLFSKRGSVLVSWYWYSDVRCIGYMGLL